MSQDARLGWIESDTAAPPLTRQCELAGVPRATVYRRLDAASRQAREGEEDLKLRALIDEEYTNHPFYGSRRMVMFLRTCGHAANRKRVQRLMREMGLAGMAPGPATSKPHPRHKVYPYLLRGVAVTRPNRTAGPRNRRRHHRMRHPELQGRRGQVDLVPRRRLPQPLAMLDLFFRSRGIVIMRAASQKAGVERSADDHVCATRRTQGKQGLQRRGLH